MSFEQLLSDLGALFSGLKENLIAFFPRMVVAIVIILIGIFIARLFQSLINRFVKKLDRFLPNEKLKTELKQMPLERSAGLIGRLIYWIIIFVFMTAATEVLGLPVISTWLGGIVEYLPNILVAAAIIFLGIIGGILLRDLINTAATTEGLVYSNLLGRLSQYTIVLVAVLIAINHIGIDVVVLTNLIGVVLLAILFGAALAFGLGARTSVSNIFASYYLQQRYREGDRVKIGDIEGPIVQITPSAVIIEAPEGQVSVPAKEFSEAVSILLKKAQ